MEPPPPYSEIDPSLNAEAAKPSVIVTQPTSIHGDVPPSATELGETEQHDDRIPFHLSNAAAGPSRASAMFPVEDEEENKKKKKEIPNNVWSADCCFCTTAATDCMDFLAHLCICCYICDHMDLSGCNCTECCDPSCCVGS